MGFMKFDTTKDIEPDNRLDWTKATKENISFTITLLMTQTQITFAVEIVRCE